FSRIFPHSPLFGTLKAAEQAASPFRSANVPSSSTPCAPSPLRTWGRRRIAGGKRLLHHIVPGVLRHRLRFRSGAPRAGSPAIQAAAGLPSRRRLSGPPGRIVIVLG